MFDSKQSLFKMPEVENRILNKNINNMFYLSIYIICFEIIMLTSYIGLRTALPPAFQPIYLGMYSFFLIFGIISFLLLRKRRKQVNFQEKERQFFNRFITIFVLIVMSWGAVITLLDQPVYGQIIAFVSNYLMCAVLIVMSPKKFLIVEAIPFTILFLLLPVFQENRAILAGHYLNLMILLILLTISNNRSYWSFYSDALNIIKIRDISEKDELTAIYNRRKMSDYIESEIISDHNSIHSISVAMLDVDYFKKYNDTYGHIHGDHVLQSIGEVLKTIADEYGVFPARYGGEEFIVIMTNISPEMALKICQQIKESIQKLQIQHKTSAIADVVTISIGLCHSTEKSAIFDIIKKQIRHFTRPKILAETVSIPFQTRQQPKQKRNWNCKSKKMCSQPTG